MDSVRDSDVKVVRRFAVTVGRLISAACATAALLAVLLIGQVPGGGQARAADAANPAIFSEPDIPVSCDLSLPSCRRWQALAKRRGERAPGPENATGTDSGPDGASSNTGSATDKGNGDAGGRDSAAPQF